MFRANLSVSTRGLLGVPNRSGAEVPRQGHGGCRADRSRENHRPLFPHLTRHDPVMRVLLIPVRTECGMAKLLRGMAS